MTFGSERLGQRLLLHGDDAGSVNLMRLAGNILTALTLQGMGEALALLRKGGLARQTFSRPSHLIALPTRLIRGHDAGRPPGELGALHISG